jgi:hypothetical protein
MYLISRLFLFLTKSYDERVKESNDAYLSEATDLYDLEFRMRKAAIRQPSWMGYNG